MIKEIMGIISDYYIISEFTSVHLEVGTDGNSYIYDSYHHCIELIDNNILSIRCKEGERPYINYGSTLVQEYVSLKNLSFIRISLDGPLDINLMRKQLNGFLIITSPVEIEDQQKQ